MGMFDSFYDSDNQEWQTKALGRVLGRFEIGDAIPGPPIDYQIEVLGAVDDEFVDSFATIRKGVLSKVPAERDEALPLRLYGGSWETDGHAGDPDLYRKAQIEDDMGNEEL